MTFLFDFHYVVQRTRMKNFLFAPAMAAAGYLSLCALVGWCSAANYRHTPTKWVVILFPANTLVLFHYFPPLRHFLYLINHVPFLRGLPPTWNIPRVQQQCLLLVLYEPEVRGELKDLLLHVLPLPVRQDPLPAQTDPLDVDCGVRGQADPRLPEVRRVRGGIQIVRPLRLGHRGVLPVRRSLLSPGLLHFLWHWLRNPQEKLYEGSC